MEILEIKNKHLIDFYKKYKNINYIYNEQYNETVYLLYKYYNIESYNYYLISLKS